MLGLSRATVTALVGEFERAAVIEQHAPPTAEARAPALGRPAATTLTRA